MKWIGGDVFSFEKIPDILSVPSSKWIKLDEPALAVMVEPQVNKEDIYHKVHVMGADWYVRTMDTMEVMSRA